MLGRFLSSRCWPNKLHRLFGRNISCKLRGLNFFVRQLLGRDIFFIQRCCVPPVRSGVLPAHRRPVDVYQLLAWDIHGDAGVFGDMLSVLDRPVFCFLGDAML